MSPTLRRARPDEWEQARDLRLEMLADTPIAYSRTLAWARAQTDDDWREAQRRAGLDGVLHLVAVDDEDRWVGQAVGRDYGPLSDTQWLAPGIAAVYLSPTARGQGLLGAMVDEIVAWLRSRGHDQCTLMVHEDNARARRAYEKLGFVPNGNAAPYPRGGRDLEYELHF